MAGRARKLYTSARIYEWKFGKGEWKLPYASPTGRVDFFGFLIIFEEKKGLTSMFYSQQKQRKHSEERPFGRFKMSLKCDRMFTLVSSKYNPVKSEASSIMRALSGARFTDVRLYTLWIKIGTNQRALGEHSHY